MSNYKKLYEIEGFDTGVKVRQKSWKREGFIYYNALDKCWLNGSNDEKTADTDVVDFNEPVWEVYEEPKKERWVKFYRVFDAIGGWFPSTFYSENNEYIDGGTIRQGRELKMCSILTDEMVYEALIDKNDEVLKCKLPSGREVRVV